MSNGLHTDLRLSRIGQRRSSPPLGAVPAGISQRRPF